MVDSEIRRRSEIRDNIDHYQPSQDEITLMEDIVNLVSVTFNSDARWYDVKEAYRCIFGGYAAMVVWEETDGTHYTHVWADIIEMEIQVKIGLNILEIVTTQNFKYDRPFERGRIVDEIIDFNHLKRKDKGQKRMYRENNADDFDYDVFLHKTTFPEREVQEESTHYVDEEYNRYLELRRNLQYAESFKEQFGTDSIEMSEEAAYTRYFFGG